MKVKVLRPFIDGNKKVIHPIGKIVEVTKERFEEMIAIEGDPLVEQVKEQSVDEEEPAPRGKGKSGKKDGDK